MGKYVIDGHAPPTQEIFSYPYAGRTYVPHEWLAGVIYYLSYVLIRLDGVILLAGILIAGTFTILYTYVSRENGEPLITFLLVLLGAVVTSVHWLIRPHLLTMIFLALWLIWLERFHRSQQVRYWIFPVSMLLWANIHAEYLVGFLVLLSYLAGWFWQYLFSRANAPLSTARVLITIAFIAFLASLLNPSGIQAWTTVTEYMNNRYLMSHIAETQPPNFTQLQHMPLIILFLVSILLLALRRDRFVPAHIFLLAGFGLMSIVSIRNAHLFGVVAPFVLSNGLKGIRVAQPLKNVEQMIAKFEEKFAIKNLPIVVTILLCIGLFTGPLKNYNQFDPEVFPVDAVQWLKQNPPSGRMFNSFDWGGYILLNLWPEQKVFIESQTDTNGELSRKYEAVITLQNDWYAIFDEYNITWALIPPQWQLAQELRALGWETDYEDQTAIILRKP